MRAALVILLLTITVGHAATPELFWQQSFNAATFAEAVNHYVELGEDGAVRELRRLPANPRKDFDRGFSVTERTGWVCRVLFAPKDKRPIRQPIFGISEEASHPLPPLKWIRYPVVLAGSTYFMLSEGSQLAGGVMAEDSRDYVEQCHQNGVFRTAKIPVPTRVQAVQDAVALRQSKAWANLRRKYINTSYSRDEHWTWEFIQKQAASIK